MDSEHSPYILEEIFNSITHGLGAILGIILILPLINGHTNGDFVRLFSFIIFGATLIIFYTISTLYHSLIFTKAKKVFKILDHSFIFLLIAATYTPFVLVLLKGKIGLVLFSLVWLISVLGVVFKCLYHSKYKHVSILLYLLFGWSSVFMIGLLSSYLSQSAIKLLMAGGGFYTLGIIFYLFKRLPFNHTIWHLFVLTGSICHIFAVSLI